MKVKKKLPNPHILVARDTYLRSIKALGIFIESAAENYETIKNSNLEDETKRIVLEIMGYHIKSVTAIGQGFESCARGSVTSDPSKGMLN